MKKTIIAMLILGCFFSAKISADAVDQKIEETMTVRKLCVSRLLTGLGRTCFHLGMAIMSPDDQGRKQAALGIVGSLLTMAGGVVEEQEKEKAGDGDLVERKRRLEGLVRSCFEEIKDNPFYLEQVKKMRNSQKRSFTDFSGTKFFDELAISGEAMQELIAEMLYAVRDALKDGLALVGITTRSINKDTEVLGQEDQEAMGFVEAMMHFISTTLQQQDTFSYLKDQLFLLVDYVRETAVACFVKEVVEGFVAGDHNGNIVTIVQEELIESVEEAIEDFVEHQKEAIHDQGSNNQ